MIGASQVAGTQRQLELWTCRLDEATQLEKNFLSGCSKISNFEIPPLRFFFALPRRSTAAGALSFHQMSTQGRLGASHRPHGLWTAP